MKTMFLTAVLAVSMAAATVSVAHANSDVVAKKGKSEPAPKDRDERNGGGETPDPREETYEGNDRNSGGSFDGGGYDGGSGGGGMMSEIFYVKQSGKNKGANIKVEDRGDVMVYTEVSHEDIDASETCTTIKRTIVDKATGKVLSSDSIEYCNRWPL